MIVNHFHKSAKDSHKLTEIQKTLNIKQHKLKNESPTRWNSLYYLMDRIVEQRQAVTVVLASNDKVNNLQNHEWKTAESYVKVLKPFEDVTSMMSASRYPTLSMVIPVLNVLKQQMDGSEMDDFGRKVCGNINERWPDYESNLDLAIPALLDPRFKEYAFSNDGAKESAVQETVDLMCHNTNSVQANQAIGFGSTSDESSGQSSTQEASTRSETASGSGNVWGIFKKMVAKKRASHTQGESREVIKQNLQKEFSIFCNDDLLEQINPHSIDGRVTVENIQTFQNWLKLTLAYQPHLCQARGYLVRQDWLLPTDVHVLSQTLLSSLCFLDTI